MLICYLILINAVSFTLMLADKRKAQKKKLRISENALITLAIIGGSIGVLAGMHLFRHKTKHLKFIIGIPMILALQIVAIVIMLS